MVKGPAAGSGTLPKGPCGTGSVLSLALWEAVDPLRGGASREAVGHWGCVLEGASGCWSLPVFLF